jgi:hypothetical protein
VCCGKKEDPDAGNQRIVDRLLTPGDHISSTTLIFANEDLRFELGVCNSNQRPGQEPCSMVNRGTEMLTGTYTIQGDRLKITQIRRFAPSWPRLCGSH